MPIKSPKIANALGQNIDSATRRKFIRSAKNRLSALKDARPEAINRLNTRDTLSRIDVDRGFTDELIYATSAQVDDDMAFSKAMHEYDKRLASFERLLLDIEKRFGGSK